MSARAETSVRQGGGHGDRSARAVPGNARRVGVKPERGRLNEPGTDVVRMGPWQDGRIGTGHVRAHVSESFGTTGLRTELRQRRAVAVGGTTGTADGSVAGAAGQGSTVPNGTRQVRRGELDAGPWGVGGCGPGRG